MKINKIVLIVCMSACLVGDAYAMASSSSTADTRARGMAALRRSIIAAMALATTIVGGKYLVGRINVWLNKEPKIDPVTEELISAGLGASEVKE